MTDDVFLMNWLLVHGLNFKPTNKKMAERKLELDAFNLVSELQ